MIDEENWKELWVEEVNVRIESFEDEEKRFLKENFGKKDFFR